MKPITAEWVSKAEGDFVMMEREARARRHRNYDGICFHAQQCVEKYLKALLAEAGLSFVRTHDLTVLLDQVLILQPNWEQYRVDLAYLSDFAVAYRYPGESASKDEALDARRRCRTFRRTARGALNLPV